MELKNLNINELTIFVIKNIDETAKFTFCSIYKNVGMFGFDIMLKNNEYVPIFLVCSKDKISVPIPKENFKSNKWNKFSFEKLNKNWKEFIFFIEQSNSQTL